MWLPATTHPGPPPNHCLHPAALQAKEKKERDAKKKAEAEDARKAAQVGRLPPPLCSLGRGEPTCHHPPRASTHPRPPPLCSLGRGEPACQPPTQCLYPLRASTQPLPPPTLQAKEKGTDPGFFNHVADSGASEELAPKKSATKVGVPLGGYAAACWCCLYPYESGGASLVQPASTHSLPTPWCLAGGGGAWRGSQYALFHGAGVRLLL